MNDKPLAERTTEGERTGQMFVYKDSNDVTKVCMVGYDVVQEEYDLMPDYLREHFDRPDDLYNKVLLTKDPSVYILPDEVVKQIEEARIESTT